jgi:N-acetylglutamate synthase-like GNAT family acetyltransferase
MDDDPKTGNDDAREYLAELRKRREITTNVISEPQRDARERQVHTTREVRPWPTPAPPPPPSAPKRPPRAARPKRTEPLHLRPPVMYRSYRNLAYDDLTLAVSWLSPLGLRPEEFVAPPNRWFVAQRVHGKIVGLGVFETYPPVGVLRAVVIDPGARRLTHGSYLASHLVRRAHQEKLTAVFAPGLHEKFLEDLGFVAVSRASVGTAVLQSPAFIDSTQPIYAVDVRPDGLRRPYSRRLPRTIVELLEKQDRRRVRGR